MKIEMAIITFIGIITIVGMLSTLYDLIFNTDDKQVIYIRKQNSILQHEHKEDLLYDELLNDITYNDDIFDTEDNKSL
jgi:hypothetical protein